MYACMHHVCVCVRMCVCARAHACTRKQKTRYLTKQKTQAQREAANEHFLLTNHHIILLTHHIILHTHHIIIAHTSHHLTYTANEHFLLTNRALTTNKSKMSHLTQPNKCYQITKQALREAADVHLLLTKEEMFPNERRNVP